MEECALSYIAFDEWTSDILKKLTPEFEENLNADRRVERAREKVLLIAYLSNSAPDLMPSETAKAELESVYPYVSGNGSEPACAYDSGSATSVNVSNYGFVTASNVSQMKAALAKQPLAVSIEADKYVFQAY